jgi:uncharacterized protein YndB with AHSA1/START domain
MARDEKHKEFTIARVFGAPRELVWKAWTLPEYVMRWWGPEGFTSPLCTIDLSVGGRYLYCMRSPDGQDFWSTGVFHEIDPPARLVVTDSFADEKGNVVPASHYGMSGDWPTEVRITVTFKERRGRTTLSLQYERTPPEEMAGPMVAGWNQSLDKLAAVLEEERSQRTETLIVAGPGKQEVVVTRTFDAPRELVFRACTDPELIPRWWGPARLTTTVEQMDARPGGTWRVAQRDTDGSEYAFHGVYHAVEEPVRLVRTFEFEGTPGHVLLETVTFEDLGGRTKLVDRSVFQTAEDRDAMLSAGMEEGSAESMERLAELLAEG